MVLQKDATIQQLQEQKDRLEFAFEVGAWVLLSGTVLQSSVAGRHPAAAPASAWQRVLQWGADCGGWL